MDLKPGDYLRIAVSAFVKGNEMLFEHDKQALLVRHLFAPDGKTLGYSQLAVSSRPLNTEASIWFTGTPEIWAEASYFIQVPKTFRPGDRIKTYVWNVARQRIYLDDMRVELWRYH